jgi:HTH-type transcriptional regulator, global nitrogen regulator NrpRI
MTRVMFEILALLERNEGLYRSAEVARELSLHGIDLSERTVRHYFKMLDKRGYTEAVAGGRRLTGKGRDELSRGFVAERVGSLTNRMNDLAFLTDFSIETRRGKVILNTTCVPEPEAKKALSLMSVALNSPFAASNRMLIRGGGERLGHLPVPRGSIGFGTVCSITVNGVFLKAGIPVSPRYGGVVEVIENVPTRFISAISYAGSSVAPLEMFVRGRMTDVLGALTTGNGKVLGSLREIPEISVIDAKRVHQKMQRHGFGGAIVFGQPGQPLLGLPVTPGNVGVVTLGGLNPVAALEEARVTNQSRVMGTLCDYTELSSVEALQREYPPDERFDTGSTVEYHCGKRIANGSDYWSVFDELKQITL